MELNSWVIFVWLFTFGCIVCYDHDHDYGGIPLSFDHLAGEPSVYSLKDRSYSSWYRRTGSDDCPLECDCPVHWPTAVYCDHNKLKEMPRKLPPRTVYLYLQNNQIKHLPQNVFSNATRIHWLILDKNEIANDGISVNVFSGIRLIGLLMNNNKLTEIPIGLPKSLKQLRLSYNQIEKISDESLANFTNLQMLLLQGNRLQAIENGRLSGLISIIHLDLSHNQLSAFPQGLPSSIQMLYLSNNSLRSLPSKSFNHFDKLRYLRIAHNKLTSLKLPPAIFNVTSLVELDLSYNELTSIPEVHRNLQYLYLEANLIKAFNITSFCRRISSIEYSRIQILRLDGNKMTYSDLPSDWGLCLRILRHIYI
ncbi:lumican-like [Protopterus annectens]|uniref:lumican-like n=1 Tax=Protopterus annectens TaxID=7888 RepID=UPI001CFA806F|nr:lumican-like [Protopterus annectens]